MRHGTDYDLPRLRQQDGVLYDAFELKIDQRIACY